MNDAQKTATLVTAGLPDFAGDAALYRCDPPMQCDYYRDAEYVKTTTEYVVVSAVNALFTGPETYIFPADTEGNVTSWLELEGSFRGAKDHHGALHRAGYEVVSCA